MTTKTSSKTSASTNPSELGLAESARVAAEAEYHAALNRKAECADTLADLENRVDNGEPVTADQLITAQTDLTIADRAATGSRARLDGARQVEQTAYAQAVANQVAETLTPKNIDAEVERGYALIAEGIAAVANALNERDRISDEAGQRLADAGVPVKTTIGRIRYAPVVWGPSARPIQGQWDITLDGQRLTYRDDHSCTAREVVRLIDKGLAAALKSSGFRMTTTGVAVL